MVMERLRNIVDQMENDLIRLRRNIHSYPEVGFKEYKTSALIKDWLKSCKITEYKEFAETGVACLIRGIKPDPVIGIRVDIDAIYAEDKTNTPYTSQNKGIVHACGHDVHTVIGLGVAKVFSTLADSLSGSVKVIFQPSEEMPEHKDNSNFDIYEEPPTGLRGAVVAVNEGVLRNPDVDALLGIHCCAGLRAGQIGYQYGHPIAGSGNFHITVSGNAGHAAQPHQCTDSIVIAAQVITALHTNMSRKIKPGDPVTMTIGTIKGGTRRSSVPGKVDMTGTVRAFDNTLLSATVPEMMERTIKGITEANSASYVFDYGVDIMPVKNDDKIVASAAKSLKQLLGDNALEMHEYDFISDDFSFMSQLVPSLYLKLGISNENSSTRHPLHSVYFNVDESCISTGVLSISKIILDILRGNP